MNPHETLSPRPFGATGLTQPALGFGCMGLTGWYGERDDAEASATLEAALERGLVHFDTAASYQNGVNERFVGAALAAHRPQVFIATKYGITRDSAGRIVIDNAPASLRRACDQSLSNLGTDYIDLYYLHRIDPHTPIEESVGELARLVAAGKIRYIGLSECSVETLRRAYAVHPVSAVQTEYSLWSRDPENGMLAACSELGTAFVAYSPLGRGFLAGNFSHVEELPLDDARRKQPRFTGENGAHNLKLVDALRAFAGRKGCSVPQLALAWVLAQGEHIFTIPGVKRRSHLYDNLGALQLRLSAAEQSELARLVQELGPRGKRHPPPMMQVIER